MTSNRWRARQGTAVLGFVPLAALILGATIGGFVAAGLGAPDWIGLVLGAVSGFFLSRWLLRRAFAGRA